MALCHLTALDKNLFSFEWLMVDFISYFECLASTFESGVGCEYCQSRAFRCPGCALPQCRDGRGSEARIVKFGSTDFICSWQVSKLRNSRSSRTSWRNLSHQSITKKMSFELLPWKYRNWRSCCEASSPLREELLVIVSPQLVKFCGAFHFGSESSMPFACGFSTSGILLTVRFQQKFGTVYMWGTHAHKYTHGHHYTLYRCTHGVIQCHVIACISDT